MKIVISSERFVEACTIMEYIGVVVGNLGSQMTALPKFVMNGDEKYIVEVVQNEEGDPIEFKNLAEAEALLNNIGVRRFEKLRKELTEAAKNIVNPPKGGDSNKLAPP